MQASFNWPGVLNVTVPACAGGVMTQTAPARTTRAKYFLKLRMCVLLLGTEIIWKQK
jgi:hypothetical protein